jgi:GTP-binding protein Era
VHRFGFVVCLGRTNVGKSTLINRVLGQKLAIVSRKPQTTRRRVRGILNRAESQVVFVDTPGLHGVNRPVNRSLERQARQGAEGADLMLAVTDPFAQQG